MGMSSIVSKYIVSFSEKNIFWLNLLCNRKLIQKCAQIPLGVYSRFSQVQPSLKSILVQHMIWLLKSPFFLLRTFGIFFQIKTGFEN